VTTLFVIVDTGASTGHVAAIADVAAECRAARERRRSRFVGQLDLRASAARTLQMVRGMPISSGHLR
jgi:hypothetical protein